MGVSVPPEKEYSPDNPFAGGKKYSSDNPFTQRPPIAQSDVTRAQMIHPEPTVESDASLPEKMADALTSFGPVQQSIAGYRGLLSLMGVGHESVDDALQSMRRNTESLPFAARAPLQMVGSTPFAAALAPLGVAGGGAALGALEGASRDAKTTGESARNIGAGAAFAALGAKGGEIAGRGVANVAARTGLTDKIAQVVGKVKPNVAAAIGTRGQVNDVLGDRQDILDAIGANGTTGNQQLSRIAATRAQAGVLYGIAKQDKQALTDPELVKLLGDPQVKRAYDIAAQIREFSGNPLKQTEGKPIIAPVSERPLTYVQGPGQTTQAVARAARRAPVEGAVNPKYRLETDDDLIDRGSDLLHRLEDYSAGNHGAPLWVRDNLPATGRSDTSPHGSQTQGDYLTHPVSGETSVAHRMRQDHELYHEVVEELKARGWPEADVNDEIKFRGPTEEAPSGKPPVKAPVQAPPPQPVAPKSNLPVVWNGPREPGVNIPDPQILSSVKRYLTNAAEGNMKSKFPMRQEEALALLPKIQAIRSKLHEVSPPWAKADAFYADAKGQEEAFADGYDAIRHARNVRGANIPKNSPEAMLQAIQEPRYPGEPPEAIARRAEAFREGVKSFTSDQVRDASVDKGLGSVMGRSVMSPSEMAIKNRSLMFRTPNESQKLEAILAAKRAAQPAPSTMPGAGFGRKITKPFTAPDLLGSPRGQGMLADRLAHPGSLPTELNAAQKGNSFLDYLKRVGSITAGGTAAQHGS